MNPPVCPQDGSALRRVLRHGVEIDICPTCQGVWLDRGELDKIIERVRPEVVMEEPGREEPEPTPPALQPAAISVREPTLKKPPKAKKKDRKPSRDRDERKYRKRRRSSLLEEILDVLDLD